MIKTKSKFKGTSILISSCIGSGAATVVSLIASALIALCILNEYLEINLSQYIVMIAQFLAALLGGVIAGKIVEDNNIIFACCGADVMYYLASMGIGLLVFDGLDGYIIWGALACVIGCAAAIFVCIRTKSGRSSKKKRRRSR